MAEIEKPGEPAAPTSPASEAAAAAKDGGEAAAGSKKEGIPDEPKKREDSSEPKKEGDKEAKRGSTKDGTDAKRKASRKASKGVDHLDDDSDEEKEDEPKIIYPIDEKIQQTLRTAWTLFVKKNQKKKSEISEADVPTVMRSIGINPTETQIKTLIEYGKEWYNINDTDSGEGTSFHAKGQDLPTCSKGFLTYENFEQRIAETLQLQPELWIRKTKDEILNALNTLCENKSEVEADRLKKILMTKGDVMTDPEGSIMLRTARDRDTGLVYIDEYAGILSKDAIPQPPPDPTVW